MTKRRDVTSHEDCLRLFSAELRKQISEDLKFWKSLDLVIAQDRQAAYSTVLKLLKDAADDTCVALQDFGMEDYSIPGLPEIESDA